MFARDAGNRGSGMMNGFGFSPTRLAGVFLLALILLLAGALPARAALGISFTQGATSLSIGEEGAWEITVTNPDPAPVNNATLTVTLPADFTVTDNGSGTESSGPPHTLTWSGLTLSANGGQRVISYQARPDCNAVDHQIMTAEIDAGAGNSQSASSSPVSVKTPVISISMVDSNGNTVTNAVVGDPVVLTLTIDNSGVGDAVHGTVVTFDLGTSLSYDGANPVSTTTGHVLPGAPAGQRLTWNTGTVAAGTQAVYEIKTVVTDCDRNGMINNVEVSWFDNGSGQGASCISPVEASTSVVLKINEPQIAISVTNPSPLQYCSGNPTTATITITNSGPGPAENFRLEISNWPATWQVSNVTSGVSFDSASNVFTIPDIAAAGDPNGHDSLTFTFEIEPAANSCPVTGQAVLVFLPDYTNTCGATHGTEYYPPVVGPQTWTMAVPNPPTLTVVKTGPATANVGQAGLTYEITVTYSGPDQAASFTTDIVDHYPADFTLTDDGGGTVDTGNHTITWPATFQNSGDQATHTIVMEVPDDPCLGFQRICNRAEVTSVPDDCRGCSGVINLDAAEVCTRILDTHGNVMDHSSLVQLSPRPADVCSDIQFKVCYTFDSAGAPSTWGTDSSNTITLDNTISPDPGSFTFLSIDKIEVNGNDYTNAFANPAFPLDLSPLTGAGAPLPSSGAELCVTYTYESANVEGNFRTVADLTVPNGGSGCGSSQAYNVEADFTVTGSRMEVTAGGTPPLINTCEIREYTITIGGFRTLYDAKVTLDTRGHYVYEGGATFTDIIDSNGNPVTAFEPVDNGDGTYTWDFRTHAANGDIQPQGTIRFKMRHGCDPDLREWRADGVYNNKCEDGNNGVGGNDSQKRAAPVSTDTPIMVLDGEPTLHLTPATIFAINPHPDVNVTIVNGGSGPLYNVDLKIALDTDLEYDSFTANAGNGPTSVDSSDSHNPVFHFDEIAPGALEGLEIHLRLIGCHDLDINASLTWCDPNNPCDTKSKDAVVLLYGPQTVVTEHVGDKLDYCNDQPAGFRIVTRNSALADAYHLVIVELLPPGVTYVANSTSATHSGGYGSLSSVPTPTLSTVGGRQRIVWDFGTALPSNPDGDPAMAPSSELKVEFKVQIEDCAAAKDYRDAADKGAEATVYFDPPCNFNSNDPPQSNARLLATEPFTPHLIIDKKGYNLTRNPSSQPWEDTLIGADAGDEIQWRITYRNDGDYKAREVTVADTLPAGLVGNVYDSTLDGNSIADTWINGYNIGTVDPGQTRTILFKTKVLQNCQASTGTNAAKVEYGCCSEPPMHQKAEDTVDLTITPYFQDPDGEVKVTHGFGGVTGQLWPVCGGTVVITLSNGGGSAINQKVTATLDSHYEVDPAGGCTITSSDPSHAFSCPTLTAGSGTVEFDHSNIDKVFPGETITIKFDAKVRTDAGTGACSVPPGSITNNVSFEFTDSCSIVSKTVSDSDTFNPRRPNLSLTVTPDQQVAGEGAPVSWRITVHNSGYTADDVVLTVDLGNGFKNPGDDQTGSWSGTTGTWNIASINQNSDWVVNVNATVFDTANGETPGSLANHIAVISHCGGAAGCVLSYPEIDAYTTAFSLEKTVDKADANVGELLTYDVKAVFSNTDTFTGTEIVDTLPGYVDYISATPQPDSDFNQAPVQSGSTLTWSPVDFQGRKVFHYLIQARIRNDAGLAGGQVLTNGVSSRFKVDYGGGHISPEFSLSDSASTTVHEPKLSLTKSISPDSGLQAGDTVTITLVVTNNGDGPAYKVNLSDLINDNNAKSNGIPDGSFNSAADVVVYDCSTITAGTTPGDFTFSTSGSAPACSVNYEITGDNAIAPNGGSRTFTFTVKIAPTMVTGSNYVNRALSEGWSLKPSDAETGNTAYDRKTDAPATDRIGSEQVSNGKSLISTSEPSTTSTAACACVAIGEVAEYRLSFAFPAGKTRAVILVDELPSGLEFIPGSATLARDNSDISTANNPGNINGSAVNTPVPVTLDHSDPASPKLDLGDVDNDSGAVAHLTLVLKCVVLNTSGNNAGTGLRDRIRMDWQDAAGTGYNLRGNFVEVRVVEPVPEIVKTATPTTAEGGDTITFTIKLCNNANGNSAASAFDWVFSDPLPADYENPQVTNIDPGSTGATVTASFTGNILNGTIDQLDPGECVTVTYTADIIAGVDFGKTVTNTAQFTTTSLPGDHGTGSATPGAPGSGTGERTGSGSGSNDLRGSDSAQVTTNIPNITKEIITPQAWYAIGDVETFKLTLGIPTGGTSNFVVTDTLPAGLVYIDNSQSVAPPAGFSSSNPPTFTWDANTRVLKWDFGNVQAVPAGDLAITYNVKVENVPANQDGTTLTNLALLTFGPNGNNTIGPVSQTMTVGEPDLYLEKTPQTTPVDLDAGDSLRYRVEFWNNGHTTAYQMDWTDVLPNLGSNNGLYNITNPALTIVSGDVYQNDTTTPLAVGDLAISTTTGNNDTIALPAFSMAPGSHFYVEFDCQLMPNVVAGETLTNETAVSYKSQVTGDHTTGVRDCETPPCNDDDDTILNNYGESAAHALTVKAKIDIVKTLVGGTDKFTIGEEYAYNLRTWVIEGVSPDVEIHDDIPTGLTLQSHNISTPGIGIISFSNPTYNTPSGNVVFAFGNVTNLDNNDTTDDHFDVELTVRVDNIAANQDGVTIANNAFVSWSAGVDVHSQDVDVEIVEPVLEVSKTVSPTTQTAGDLVTYTVVVHHASASTDDAYDLVIKDALPAGLTFISSTEPNTGSGQNLEFHKASLLQGETWQFSYTVRVDAGASGTLTNDLKLEWASRSGANGGTHSGRNGINCGQATPLNDYCDADNAALEVVIPGIDLQKTVYLGHDHGASCPGNELAVGVNGKEITYCFTVTNTGETWFDDLTIKDGDLGINNISQLTLLSGSLPLAPNGVLVYYYETTINGDLTNSATATATPTDSGGTPIPGASNVTDTDTARVDEVAPNIELAKTVYYGHDSGASAPGGELAVGGNGSPVTYCFTVTNTGDTYLNDLTIKDGNLGINNISQLTLLSGSLPLAPNGVLVYYYETTINGDLTNSATATGNPTDSGGTDLPEVDKPSATDTAEVKEANPGIEIQKTVYRGHDHGASWPGGELVTGEHGSPVTYCFTVTNTGDTYLNDIAIGDVELGIDITNLTLHSGSLPLAPNGILVYYYETTITRDQINHATATGNPTDSGGADLPGFTNPSATDTAQVDQVGPGIEIQQTVYSGHDGGVSCPGGELVSDIINAPVTYCFVVTNTGDTYLTDVTLTDPALGLNVTLTPGPLAPGGTVTYHYETTINGDLTSQAATTGHPSDDQGNIFAGVPDPTDSDPAAVDQLDPGIELRKTVYSGHDGGAGCSGNDKITVGLVSYTPPGGTPVIVPTEITYCFTVTNTGGTYLDDLTIVDNDLNLNLGDLKLISGHLPLAPGASISYYYETSTSRSLVNHAEARANPVRPDGTDLLGLQNPSSQSMAEVVIDPAIPTLNEWGMIVLMLLISVGMVWYRRRRGNRLG